MKFRSLLGLVAATLLAVCVRSRTAAEDWGVYGIVPSAAQGFTLEVAEPGTPDGMSVSINKPSGKPNQKWNVVQKEDGYFAIKPTHDPSLALSAAQGGAKMGTAIIVAKDEGNPSQLWKLSKQDNGSYTLTPKHAPELGLDHFGGKLEVGAKIDLWTLKAADPHLRWFIRPLAGSGVAEAKRKRDRRTNRRPPSRKTSCPARPNNSGSPPARSFPAPCGM